MHDHLLSIRFPIICIDSLSYVNDAFYPFFHRKKKKLCSYSVETPTLSLGANLIVLPLSLTIFSFSLFLKTRILFCNINIIVLCKFVWSLAPFLFSHSFANFNITDHIIYSTIFFFLDKRGIKSIKSKWVNTMQEINFCWLTNYKIFEEIN